MRGFFVVITSWKSKFREEVAFSGPPRRLSATQALYGRLRAPNKVKAAFAKRVIGIAPPMHPFWWSCRNLHQ